jgi:prepilin signal peptidase PulO-like enzyme (type II secretory pathway)
VRREGFGGGDIKLFTAIGFFLGIKGLVFFIFAWSAIGTIIGIWLMISRRQTMRMAIRTGILYALGLACVLLFPSLPDWYLYDYARSHPKLPLAIESLSQASPPNSFGAGVRDVK